jgi:hypothetical protein
MEGAIGEYLSKLELGEKSDPMAGYRRRRSYRSEQGRRVS